MFLLSRDHVLELHHLHLQPHLLQALQVLDVDLLNGRVIITVMMKTTMQIVNMMVEIAVEIMSTPNTALHVNVWIPMNNLLKLPLKLLLKPLLKLPLKPPLNLHKMLVDLLNGLVIIIVMMKTTMKVSFYQFVFYETSVVVRITNDPHY